jgi:cell division inhibitor SepF
MKRYTDDDYDVYGGSDYEDEFEEEYYEDNFSDKVYEYKEKLSKAIKKILIGNNKKQNEKPREKYERREAQEYSNGPEIINRAPILNHDFKMAMVSISPDSVDTARTVCDSIKDDKICIVRLEGLDPFTSQRISDFICGSTYMSDGNIERLSDYIFIAAPASVEITDADRDIISKKYKSYHRSG